MLNGISITREMVETALAVNPCDSCESPSCALAQQVLQAVGFAPCACGQTWAPSMPVDGVYTRWGGHVYDGACKA